MTVDVQHNIQSRQEHMKLVLRNAILAMDAYNRSNTPDVGVFVSGSKIAGATVYDLSSTSQSSYSTTFSATTYVLDGGNSQYIISYRGTDHLLTDAFTGFAQGGGGLDPQAIDAINYYNNVRIAINVDPNGSYAPTISTTGHSLGGGLAGLTSALYGLDSIIFNSMPFQSAAQKYHDIASGIGSNSELLYSQFLRDTIYGSGPITPTSLDKPAIYSNPHEILGILRHFDTSYEKELETGDGPWLTSPFLGHSMALEVALVYAAANNFTDWLPASQYLWSAFSSGDVSGLVDGLNQYIGTSTPNEAMQALIAYSAVDPTLSVSDKPFGDTAVAAMFNDATDMAVAVNGTPNSAFQRSAQTIANLALVYAGDLATAKIYATGRPDAVHGILSAGTAADVLAVDLTGSTWSFSPSALPNSLKTSLIEDSLGAPARVAEFKQALSEYNANTSGYSAISSVAYQTSALRIGRATSIPAGNIEVTFMGEGYFQADTTDEPTSTIRAVVLSVNGNQNIIGHDEDDIFLGGNGNNVIRGGGGRNVLFGGRGDDTIYSTGQDIVNGGAGNDLIMFNGNGGTVSFATGDGHDVVETASFDGSYTLKLDGLSLSDLSFVIGGYTSSPDFYFWQGYLNPKFLTVKINSTGETITFKNSGVDISLTPDTDPTVMYTDFAKKYSPLDAIQFGDGSVMNRSDLWNFLYQWNNPQVLNDLVWDETRSSYWTNQTLTAPGEYIDHINAEYFQAEPQTLGGSAAMRSADWTCQALDSAGGDEASIRVQSSTAELVQSISTFEAGNRSTAEFIKWREPYSFSEKLIMAAPEMA